VYVEKWCCDWMLLSTWPIASTQDIRIPIRDLPAAWIFSMLAQDTGHVVIGVDVGNMP